MRDRSAREGPEREAKGSLSGSRIVRLARTATATTREWREERERERERERETEIFFEQTVTTPIAFILEFSLFERLLIHDDN